MGKKHDKEAGSASSLPEYYTPTLIRWSMIPEKMHHEIHRYIQHGVQPGDFVFAFVSNNLKETFRTADDENKRRIEDYIKFFYNYAPSECWGEKERVDEWLREGGLLGYL